MASTNLDLRLLQVGSKRSQLRFQPDSSLQVETPAASGAWGAISPPFSEWTNRESMFTAPVYLSLDLQVQSGILGVVVLNDFGVAIGNPVVLRSDFLRDQFLLNLEQLPVHGRLLFFNCNDSRRKCSLQVFSIVLAEQRTLKTLDKHGAALNLRELIPASPGAELVHGRDSASVATGQGSGAFGALSVQIGEWGRSRGLSVESKDLPAVLRIDLEVQTGVIGISLAEHRADVISEQEQTCHAAPRSQTVWLLVGTESLDKRLLLRNCDASGDETTARISSIRIAPQPPVVQLAEPGIVLDTLMVRPAMPGATVEARRTSLKLASSGEPSSWIAVSPPIDAWAAWARLATGAVPCDACVLELDLQVQAGEACFSLITAGPSHTVGTVVKVMAAEGRRRLRLPLEQGDLRAGLVISDYGAPEAPAEVTLHSAKLLPRVHAPVAPAGLALDLFQVKPSARDAVIRWEEGGTLEFVTDRASGSCAFQSPRFSDWYRDTVMQSCSSAAFPSLLVLDAEVTAGDVRFALTDTEHQSHGPFKEHTLHVASGRRRIYFYVQAASDQTRLSAYNVSSTTEPAWGRLHSVRLMPVGHSRSDLLIEGLEEPLPAGRPLLCVTHSERVTERHSCSLNYLQSRYVRPNGFAGIAPFDSLPALPANRFKGAVTLWSFEDSDWSSPRLVAALWPPFKPQHTIWHRDRLWVLGYDRVEVFDANLEHVATITDPWLADGHTIASDGRGALVVSCSSSDALLFIDEVTFAVTRAFRMPVDLYGSNYDLQRTDSVVDHFIRSEAQTTHVNGASSWQRIRKGGLTSFWRRRVQNGIVFSTLIQGSIAWLGEDGSFEEIARGFVGCHGVRADQRDNDLYFSDSTTGTVVFMDAAGRLKGRFDACSYWLHDSLQLDGGDVFALALSDRNVVELYNVRTKELLGTIDGRPFGEGPQFLHYGF